MPRQHIILVDERDSEKFRQFKMCKFNTETQNILDKNKLKFIWGFHKGQISDSWKNVEENDHVFFSIPNNNFEVKAQVTKKIIDKKLGKILWPDNLSSQEITHFLLFDAIQQTNLLFTQTLDNTVQKIKIPFPGIYELRKNFIIDNIMSELSPGTRNKPHPKPFVMPSTNKISVSKKLFEVTRFLRDPVKVKKLKELYQNKCQICGHTFEYDKDKFYSEVHHYNPLNASADDEMDNMLVVCPNHHAQFDYNIIAIDLSGRHVIDKHGNKITTICFKDGHRLNTKNIKSQLDGI